MKVFNKKTVETSNDLYEAYKAELSGEVKTKRLFSLENIIKLELVVVVAGLFMMNQNGLSLELKKTDVAMNEVLPVSEQYASLDKELVVTHEEEPTALDKVEIREENQAEVLVASASEKDTYSEKNDMKLLIELLQSEVEEAVKPSRTSDSRVIISQNIDNTQL